MDPASASAPSPGQPRNEHDRTVLARFGADMRIPIVLAAVLPLFIVPESGDWVAALVGVVSWLVFLADFTVSERRRVRYLSTALGRWAGVIIMISGISVVGILAGSLASFFRFDDSQSGNDSSVQSDASGEPTPPPEGDPYQVLAREMAQLREQMARLTEQPARDSPGGSRDRP